MNDIVISFSPFLVSSPPDGADFDCFSFEFDGKKIFGKDVVNWCSLPDILYEENGRRFVGLSFSISEEHLGFAKQLSRSFDHEGVLVLPSSEDGFMSRYEGFGENSRFEIYFSEAKGEVVCEFASLYDGCWLFDSVGSESVKNVAPFGYWISLVGDIKEEYDLT